ncbi:hypothetical protein DSM104443_00726 [Usitatibacter rugosus]|uniref:DUF4124 domain-containing protein n=1 Tax=Usitatibacter rugosus TaxID=2732067 RepID=A0A6M4GVK1_9PROT|nr:DUF4124 domain-containing protein [Usitatibacter rugosus]QJR09677.1 hypothetical protein DSM104443_00726 [Usitatibacter rugosus]
MTRSMLFILAFAASLAANAQVLYKLVDKNGKITYAEKIPPGFDGKATQVDVDPNRNTATLPKVQSSSPSESGPSKSAFAPSPRQVAEAKREKRIEEAKKQLDAAKAELASALENPSDSDVTRVGNAGGGSRPVFSDEYKARIASLEQKVKDAEKAVSNAETF